MINLKNFTNMSWYNWEQITTANVTPGGESSIILHNFDILDRKIDVATRSLDFYDVYRFVDSVNSNLSYLNKFASIPNNTSLAVVADFKSYDNRDYHIGDIIIKGDKGQEILVKGKQNGIFVPQYFQINGTTVTIKMGVITNLTELNTWTSSTIPGWTSISYDNNNESDIQIPGFEGEHIYNSFVSPNNSATIDFVSDPDSDKIIYPIIKFYSETGEEVSYDGITYNTTNFTVECNSYVNAVVR